MFPLHNPPLSAGPRVRWASFNDPGELLAGLPEPSDSLDYAVSMHALQDLPYADLGKGLRELWRVLKPRGVLRLGLPDLDRAIRAYLRKDLDYFRVPDREARSAGGKLVVHLLGFGAARTPMNFDFISERLMKEGFRQAAQCEFGRTLSRYAEITALDTRRAESFYVEAVK